MSKGSWGKLTKAGLIFFGLAGIALAGLGYYKGALLERSYQHEALQEASDYRSRAAQKRQLECLTLPPLSEAECTNKIEDAIRANEREERDLEAQRTTAAWTALMGAAALVGMAFSMIGVALVFVTFRETRDGNEMTKLQIRANLAPEIGAQVSLDQDGHGKPVGIAVSLVNKGGPAVQVLAFCRVTAADWGFERVEFHSDENGRLAYVGEREVVHFRHPSFTFAPEEIAARIHEGRQVEVEVEIHYNAAFRAALPSGEARLEHFHGILRTVPHDEPAITVQTRFTRHEQQQLH